MYLRFKFKIWSYKILEENIGDYLYRFEERKIFLSIIVKWEI